MRLAFLAAPAVALAVLTAACNQGDPAPAPAPDEMAAPSQSVAQTPDDRAVAPASDRSCLDEIGAEASAQLVDRCRAVSPATRPPCNEANPCVMIQAEIDRACALWARDGNPPEACRPA